MTTGVIFDADGTLLDSMEIWSKVTPMYLSERGFSITKEDEKKIYSMSLEEGSSYIKGKYGLKETCDEIKNGILSIINDFYTKEVQLKPGVYELLKYLQNKKIPMCVASAGNKALMKAAFTRLGVYDCFWEILTCSDLLVNKSVPVIFDKSAEILGTKPDETYVFEDSLLAIKTAEKAGYKVCGVSDFFNQDDTDEIKKHSDIYVSDFTKTDFSIFLD